MVDAFNFAELDRINGEANVSVAGEPCTVMLIVRFVSQADAIAFYASMATHVENCWQGRVLLHRTIEIARDVKAWA